VRIAIDKYQFPLALQRTLFVIVIDIVYISKESKNMKPCVRYYMGNMKEPSAMPEGELINL
jgi:hypothetical protein